MGAGNIMSAIAHHQTVRRRKTMFGQNMGEQSRACLSGWPMSPDCRIALLSAVLGRWRMIRRETWANERFHDWQRRSRLRRERGPVGEVFCHRLVMGIC